jgi:Na+/phosphate symporter
MHICLKIARAGAREERVNESFQILYTVKELELIADVVSSSMHESKYWLKAGHSFSEEGRQELVLYHEKPASR